MAQYCTTPVTSPGCGARNRTSQTTVDGIVQCDPGGRIPGGRSRGGRHQFTLRPAGRMLDGKQSRSSGTPPTWNHQPGITAIIAAGAELAERQAEGAGGEEKEADPK